ncbi:SpoIID/LytB domain-containing protein [Pseudobdellovibrio sp. HCB154]|uniref:SpoIID/LytB domain-containing protein n=1 Tax=Pseudobdellovibrio sp. HCB154 TaxID=3386277 RepID=UPI0039172DC5
MVFKSAYFIVTLALALFVSAQALAQNGSEFSQVRVRIQKDLTQYPKNLTANFGQYIRKYEVVHKENGKFDVVEVVPLTHYLAGVVSKEMPLAWPAEALKAQAVVARSYLFTRMSERRDKLFHVENDQMDQVFEWTDSAKAYQVVLATDDVVLSSNKKVVKTFYHSDCGGQTVPANKVWTGAVDLGTTQDPWCGNRSSNQWSFSVPAVEFSQKEVFEAAYFKKKLVRFEDWGIQKLRQVFGFSKIRSSPDTVEVSEDVVTFTGRGFGHGVGLCQWGSLYMAKKGRTYMDILTHYYPKAEILKIQSLLIKNYLTNNEIPKTINKTGIIYNN